MSSGLINNVQSLISSGANARPANNVPLPHQQSLASASVLNNTKQKDKELSKNIETVLNKLSSKVSSDKVKSQDSEAVADIEQDIGSILNLTKNEGEDKSSIDNVSDSLFSNGSQIDDVELKQGIVDILSVASDILDSQTEAGEDESFTLSLIADLLGMLEKLMGITSSGTGTTYTSQDRFSLLIEYIDLIRDDLIETGEGRFSDVINLIDQQLEEQRYRDRESMKGFSQLDYLKRKGGRG